MSFASLRLKLSKLIGLFIFLVFCFNEIPKDFSSPKSFMNEMDKLFFHENPNKSMLLLFFGILFVGIGVMGRIWCSLFISGYKNNKLVTYGPYSMCRNPLYFFSLIGVIGVAMTTQTYLIPLTIIVLFAFYYPYVIQNEQNFLLGVYKEEFVEYIKNVPCFFPDFSKYNEPEEYVVKPKRFKRFLTEVIWFIWMVGFIQLIIALKQLHYLPVYFHFNIF